VWKLNAHKMGGAKFFSHPVHLSLPPQEEKWKALVENSNKDVAHRQWQRVYFIEI